MSEQDQKVNDASQVKITINATCATCTHWHKEASGQLNRGLCIAVPPTPALLFDKRTGQQGQVNIRPATQANEVCGLWIGDPARVQAAANASMIKQ